MGNMITCPLCGGAHPEGTTFCDVMWGEIPQESEDEAPIEGVDANTQDDGQQIAEAGRCPSCGAVGHPGDECWQCGSTIERSACEEQRRSVVLRVEGGRPFALEPGKTIVIGREGDTREISEKLTDYDVVSRRHCSIRLSQDSTMVTITDCGSTNGTFIGPDAERLDRDMTCTARLPVQIRLGSCVGITLEVEG